MAVTREKLYEEVWAEPMTKVAARYGVSSSFLARVCERLNVPRPSRGYWAQLEVGKASVKPVLPEARPGDELEWSHSYGRWGPDRPTVVYVGTVAIGLTLFELSEEVEVRYVDGKYIRVADIPQPTTRRRRWAPPEHVWTHKRDMPSGRLCLRASSPYALAKWEKQWRESKGSDLSSKVPHIVRELEAEAATIAALVAEGERQAEIERQKWKAQQVKWRAEEAERRRIQNTKESREELFAIIEAWGVAKQIEGFFEDAQRRAAELDEDASHSRGHAKFGDRKVNSGLQE